MVAGFCGVNHRNLCNISQHPHETLQQFAVNTLTTLMHHHQYKIKGAVVQRCSVKMMFLEISQNSQKNTCARVSFLIKLQASGFPLPNAKHGSESMTSWPKEQQIYKNYLKTLKKNFPGGEILQGGKRKKRGRNSRGIFTSPTWTNTVFSTKIIILHTFSSISLISNSR